MEKVVSFFLYLFIYLFLELEKTKVNKINLKKEQDANKKKVYYKLNKKMLIIFVFCCFLIKADLKLYMHIFHDVH